MSVEVEVRDIVFQALRILNDEFPADQQVEISNDTLLFGGISTIDSLSLVSVIVDVETEVGSKFKPIALTDDRAMSRDPSPFTSVGVLVDYIVELLSE